MDLVTAVGYLAAICSTTSFAPQAWKIVKTHDTSAISAGMYTVTVIGFALWTAFGLLKSEWPIVLTNTICFCFALFILGMKLLSKPQKDSVAKALDPTA